MQQPPSLARDPFFYVTVLFFIPLTTVLPAVLGQFRFMPIIQTISLTVFLAVAIRQRQLAPSFIVIALWAILQFLIIWGLTSIVPNRIEQAIPNGFAQGRGFLEWFHGQGILPGGSILWRMLESIGVLIGSLISGGAGRHLDLSAQSERGRIRRGAAWQYNRRCQGIYRWFAVVDALPFGELRHLYRRIGRTAADEQLVTRLLSVKTTRATVDWRGAPRLGLTS